MTEITAEMKNEAIKRMEMLDILPQTIREFANEGKVNKSVYGGILYWLDEEEKAVVKEFEDSHNCIVYHAIKCKYRMCDNSTLDCLDLLYVSQYEEEWDMEREELDSGYAMVYTISDMCDGEYGTIVVKSLNGGVARVA